MPSWPRVVVLSLLALSLGCAGVARHGPTSTAPVRPSGPPPVWPPPSVTAPECGVLVGGEALPVGTPVHVRRAGPLQPSAAIDPSGRYFAATSDDGVAVFSLAWGREVYRVEVRDRWAWLGPGRFVYVDAAGDLIALELEHRSASTVARASIPEHARVNPESGAVAWLSASDCVDKIGCVIELSWGTLGGAMRRIAIPTERWWAADLRWIGADGSVDIERSRAAARAEGAGGLGHGSWDLDNPSRLLVGAGGRPVSELRYKDVALDGRWVFEHGYARDHAMVRVDDAGKLRRVHGFDEGSEPRPLAVDRAGQRLAWLDGATLKLMDLGDGQTLAQWPEQPAALARFVDGCGLLIADERGRLSYLPSEPDAGEPRTLGLVDANVALIGGSIAGELELLVDGVHSRWSDGALARGQELGGARIEGGWLITASADSIELSPHGRAGAVRRIPWPALGGALVRRGVAVSPDGRRAAVTGVAELGDGVLAIAVELHDLDGGARLWSRRLDSHLTALALTDEQLWAVVQSGERAAFTAYDAASGEIVRRWLSEPLAGTIVAITADSKDSVVYALLDGPPEVRAWSKRGVAGPALPLRWSREPDERAACPCDLDGGALRLSSDGELLIATTETSELVRLADGAALLVADQLGFADERGHVFARDGGRVSAWAAGDAAPLWQLQVYAGGAWVWSEADVLRGVSPAASDMVAAKLELRREAGGQ